MNALESPDLQSTFRALADPSRRRILSLLSEGPMSVAELSGHFDMTRAAVKKHLLVLEDGQLVAAAMHGRERISRLQPRALQQAAAWLEQFDKFWDDRLGALERAIDAEKITEKEGNS